MTRIFVAGNGLCDWRARLADPDRHWVRERSAFETAVSWELAQHSPTGIPAAVAGVLNGHDLTRDAVALIVIPEHKVAMPGRGKASQNDAWALCRSPKAFISMAVEGKAGEPFDKTLGEWLSGSKTPANRKARLSGLCGLLGRADPPPTELRYQLFHRAASALIEAKRCTCSVAVLMVQSFRTQEGFQDFERFGAYVGAQPVPNQICEAADCGGITLLLGWAECQTATDNEIARVDNKDGKLNITRSAANDA